MLEPEIREKLHGHAEVLLDGGVRRGTDALKALALGARGVLIGRAMLWGLAAAGEEGVTHILDLLRKEVESSRRRRPLKEHASYQTRATRNIATLPVRYSVMLVSQIFDEVLVYDGVAEAA